MASESPRRHARVVVREAKAATAARPSMLLLVLACCAVQFCFSGYAIVLKEFAQDAHLNPVFFSMCRDVACIPVLFAAAFALEGWRTPGVRDLLLFAALGLAGMYGNQLLFILGLYYTSPNVASIFQPIVPALTAMLAVAVGVEKLDLSSSTSWFKIGGIVASIGGAATMVLSQGVGGHARNFVLGNLFLLANTSCMAVYVLTQKRFVFLRRKGVLSWHSWPITVTAWSYAFGALFMCLSCLYYVGSQRWDVFDFSRKLWIPLAYAVLMSSSLAYGLISWTNKYLVPSMVTAFWPVQVPTTVIMSHIFFGDSLVAWQYVGAVLIVAGLFSVTYANHREAQETQVGSGAGGAVAAGDAYVQPAAAPSQQQPPSMVSTDGHLVLAHEEEVQPLVVNGDEHDSSSGTAK